MASTKGVALITGSSQRLGRAIADDGFDISINDSDLALKTTDLHVLAAEIAAKGRRSCVVPGDVSVEVDVINIIDHTVQELRVLNVMVAAGVCIPRSIAMNPPLCHLDDLYTRLASTEDWNHTFTVSGRGTFLCYKDAAKQMIKQVSDLGKSTGDELAFYDSHIAMSPMGQLLEPTDIASIVSYLASSEERLVTDQSMSVNSSLFFKAVLT
ncbi:NAD(P)-binding protein [Guyanagaster necrorhizus]|uniref:NAD(P)-binding protein n=1 Tax=Guyanagaster necrorhizus TaxID=856835 RepID=A0A9P8AUE3_9AGAR|nr:NAD(P)-binding protein [Guyanagaster necrorhizus MCA 3950]KAG7448399.1 NAD(P)-binding protein [Guyanagaster necrorhizus MCA 3950]